MYRFITYVLFLFLCTNSLSIAQDWPLGSTRKSLDYLYNRINAVSGVGTYVGNIEVTGGLLTKNVGGLTYTIGLDSNAVLQAVSSSVLLTNTVFSGDVSGTYNDLSLALVLDGVVSGSYSNLVFTDDVVSLIESSGLITVSKNSPIDIFGDDFLTSQISTSTEFTEDNLNSSWVQGHNSWAIQNSRLESIQSVSDGVDSETPIAIGFSISGLGLSSDAYYQLVVSFDYEVAENDSICIHFRGYMGNGGTLGALDLLGLSGLSCNVSDLSDPIVGGTTASSLDVVNLKNGSSGLILNAGQSSDAAFQILEGAGTFSYVVDLRDLNVEGLEKVSDLNSVVVAISKDEGGTSGLTWIDNFNLAVLPQSVSYTVSLNTSDIISALGDTYVSSVSGGLLSLNSGILSLSTSDIVSSLVLDNTVLHNTTEFDGVITGVYNNLGFDAAVDWPSVVGADMLKSTYDLDDDALIDATDEDSVDSTSIVDRSIVSSDISLGTIKAEVFNTEIFSQDLQLSGTSIIVTGLYGQAIPDPSAINASRVLGINPQGEWVFSSANLGDMQQSEYDTSDPGDGKVDSAVSADSALTSGTSDFANGIVDSAIDIATREDHSLLYYDSGSGEYFHGLLTNSPLNTGIMLISSYDTINPSDGKVDAAVSADSAVESVSSTYTLGLGASVYTIPSAPYDAGVDGKALVWDNNNQNFVFSGFESKMDKSAYDTDTVVGIDVIDSGAVTTLEILDGTITSDDMANGTINSNKITDGGINKADLDNTVLSEDSVFSGDLSSTYSSIVVDGLRGFSLPAPTSANNNQVLTFNYVDGVNDSWKYSDTSFSFSESDPDFNNWLTTVATNLGVLDTDYYVSAVPVLNPDDFMAEPSPTYQLDLASNYAKRYIGYAFNSVGSKRMVGRIEFDSIEGKAIESIHVYVKTSSNQASDNTIDITFYSADGSTVWSSISGLFSSNPGVEEFFEFSSGIPNVSYPYIDCLVTFNGVAGTTLYLESIRFKYTQNP